MFVQDNGYEIALSIGKRIETEIYGTARLRPSKNQPGGGADVFFSAALNRNCLHAGPQAGRPRGLYEGASTTASDQRNHDRS